MEDQASYLQQLKEQAGLDRSDPKERLLSELTDTVSLLCHQIYSMDAVVTGQGQTLEEMQEVLEILFQDDAEPESGDQMGIDEYFDGSESPLYEVKCPACKDRFAVDEDTLIRGFSCPTCGQKLIQAE